MKTMGLLWFAMLAGPIAWLAGLNLQYSLVRVACAGETMLPLHVVALATLAVTGVGGWVGWREWRRAGGGWPTGGAGTESRTSFMALFGMLTAALFALAILAQWMGNLFLHPCMGV